MKRVLTVMAAAALLSGSAAAQWGRGFGRGWAAGQPGARAQASERRLEFLAGYLNLSEGQKAQFKSAQEALQAKTQASAQKAQELRLKLQEAVRNNAGAPAIQALANQLGQLHAELIAARAQTQATLLGVLTQEQRDKLAKICPRGCGLGLGGGLGAGLRLSRRI